MRLIAMGTVPGSAGDQPLGILLGGAVGASLVFLNIRVLSKRQVRAATAAQWLGLYFLVMAPATSAMVAVLIATGVPGAGPLGFLIATAATWGTAMGLAWVVDQYLSRLRSSADLRQRLNSLVLATTAFDNLLEQAEQSRFTNYGEIVARSVLAPLQALRERSSDLDDAAYAQELDDIVTGTMRPLAHMLHPVSVRTGLVPALRALGSQLEIVADQGILDKDAAGALIDPNVRVQVYRWARHLRSELGSVRLVFWASEDRLHLEAEGVTQFRDLDPIQRIAGLESLTNQHLTAPLLGTTATFEAQMPVTRGSFSWRLADWRVLFTPSQVISPGIVAILCAGTAPGLSFINSVTVTPAVIAALVMAVVIPTSLAFACSRITVRKGSTRGALGALGLWAVIGLASASAQVLILSALASTMMTKGLVISLAIRGVLRLSIPGALWMSVQSLTRVNDESAGELQAQLENLKSSHQRTLAEADLRDREISETLHRNVQGRLSAASLMIRLSRRTEADVVVDGIVDQTLPELLASLSSPDHPLLASTTPGRSTRTFDLYGLSITADVDWDALEQLSPVLVDDLRRTLSENLENAVRHGRATAATVEATITPDTITVTCADNGAGLDLQAHPGLGSRIHDEVAEKYTGSWSISRDDQRTVFRLTVHP